MDPVTFIVAALAAGVTAGLSDAVKDNAKQAAKAAYDKLQNLVRGKFHGNTSAEVILQEHQADPDAYEVPLTKKLKEAGAADDDDLLAAAKELMELLDQAGTKSGKYNVTVSNAKGVQIGDHSHQTNTFG